MSTLRFKRSLWKIFCLDSNFWLNWILDGLLFEIFFSSRRKGLTVSKLICCNKKVKVQDAKLGKPSSKVKYLLHTAVMSLAQCWANCICICPCICIGPCTCICPCTCIRIFVCPCICICPSILFVFVSSQSQCLSCIFPDLLKRQMFS